MLIFSYHNASIKKYNCKILVVKIHFTSKFIWQVHHNSGLYSVPLFLKSDKIVGKWKLVSSSCQNLSAFERLNPVQWNSTMSYLFFFNRFAYRGFYLCVMCDLTLTFWPLFVLEVTWEHSVWCYMNCYLCQRVGRKEDKTLTYNIRQLCHIQVTSKPQICLSISRKLFWKCGGNIYKSR